MLDVALEVCPQYKYRFEEVSLSRSTVWRELKHLVKTWHHSLKELYLYFNYFHWYLLDESTYIDDSAQLLILYETF